MVTVALPGLPRVIPLGSKDETIIRVKFSLVSTVSSLTMGISNKELVIPAGNLTMYGPES